MTRDKRRIGQQPVQQRPLAGGLDEMHVLLDRQFGGRGAGDVHPHRIAQQGLGELADLCRHGRREQRRLPLAPAGRRRYGECRG